MRLVTVFTLVICLYLFIIPHATYSQVDIVNDYFQNRSLPLKEHKVYIPQIMRRETYEDILAKLDGVSDIKILENNYTKQTNPDTETVYYISKLTVDDAGTVDAFDLVDILQKNDFRIKGLQEFTDFMAYMFTLAEKKPRLLYYEAGFEYLNYFRRSDNRDTIKQAFLTAIKKDPDDNKIEAYFTLFNALEDYTLFFKNICMTDGKLNEKTLRNTNPLISTRFIRQNMDIKNYALKKLRKHITIDMLKHKHVDRELLPPIIIDHLETGKFQCFNDEKDGGVTTIITLLKTFPDTAKKEVLAVLSGKKQSTFSPWDRFTIVVHCFDADEIDNSIDVSLFKNSDLMVGKQSSCSKEMIDDLLALSINKKLNTDLTNWVYSNGKKYYQKLHLDENTVTFDSFGIMMDSLFTISEITYKSLENTYKNMYQQAEDGRYYHLEKNSSIAQNQAVKPVHARLLDYLIRENILDNNKIVATFTDNTIIRDIALLINTAANKADTNYALIKQNDMSTDVFTYTSYENGSLFSSMPADDESDIRRILFDKLWKESLMSTVQDKSWKGHYTFYAGILNTDVTNYTYLELQDNQRRLYTENQWQTSSLFTYLKNIAYIPIELEQSSYRTSDNRSLDKTLQLIKNVAQDIEIVKSKQYYLGSDFFKKVGALQKDLLYTIHTLHVNRLKKNNVKQAKKQLTELDNALRVIIDGCNQRARENYRKILNNNIKALNDHDMTRETFNTSITFTALMHNENLHNWDTTFDSLLPNTKTYDKYNDDRTYNENDGSIQKKDLLLKVLFTYLKDYPITSGGNSIKSNTIGNLTEYVTTNIYPHLTLEDQDTVQSKIALICGENSNLNEIRSELTTLFKQIHTISNYYISETFITLLEQKVAIEYQKTSDVVEKKVVDIIFDDIYSTEKQIFTVTFNRNRIQIDPSNASFDLHTNIKNWIHLCKIFDLLNNSTHDIDDLKKKKIKAATYLLENCNITALAKENNIDAYRYLQVITYFACLNEFINADVIRDTYTDILSLLDKSVDDNNGTKTQLLFDTAFIPALYTRHASPNDLIIKGVRAQEKFIKHNEINILPKITMLLMKNGKHLNKNEITTLGNNLFTLITNINPENAMFSYHDLKTLIHTIPAIKQAFIDECLKSLETSTINRDATAYILLSALTGIYMVRDINITPETHLSELYLEALLDLIFKIKDQQIAISFSPDLLSETGYNQIIAGIDASTDITGAGEKNEYKKELSRLYVKDKKRNYYTRKGDEETTDLMMHFFSSRPILNDTHTLFSLWQLFIKKSDTLRYWKNYRNQINAFFILALCHQSNKSLDEQGLTLPDFVFYQGAEQDLLTFITDFSKTVYGRQFFDKKVFTINTIDDFYLNLTREQAYFLDFMTLTTITIPVLDERGNEEHTMINIRGINDVIEYTNQFCYNLDTIRRGGFPPWYLLYTFNSIDVDSNGLPKTIYTWELQKRLNDKDYISNLKTFSITKEEVRSLITDTYILTNNNYRINLEVIDNDEYYRLWKICELLELNSDEHTLITDYLFYAYNFTYQFLQNNPHKKGAEKSQTDRQKIAVINNKYYDFPDWYPVAGNFSGKKGVEVHDSRYYGWVLSEVSTKTIMNDVTLSQIIKITDLSVNEKGRNTITYNWDEPKELRFPWCQTFTRDNEDFIHLYSPDISQAISGNGGTWRLVFQIAPDKPVRSVVLTDGFDYDDTSAIFKLQRTGNTKDYQELIETLHSNRHFAVLLTKEDRDITTNAANNFQKKVFRFKFLASKYDEYEDILEDTEEAAIVYLKELFAHIADENTVEYTYNTLEKIKEETYE